ncbi:MAG: rod shape-determining protein RodA, partial [Azoarcus sp.]|nr:rod shape-determining protein RodA [Azoarcus sp.]
MAPPRRLRPSQLLAALIRPLDPVLLMIVGCLMLYSTIIIWSAAPGRLMQHLTVNITISLLSMWIVALIPLRRLLSFSPLFYIAGVALLIAVHLFGSVSKGAQRWLEIGFSQRIQPSELMKIAMPMALAWFFQKREHNINWWGFLVAFLLLSVPVYLIAKQPDLGTAILISTSGLYVIFFAGLPWKLILPVLIAGFAAVIAFSIYGDQICQEGIRWPVLKPYQQDRVCTMLDPTRDRKGKGFHIIQSTIAIGSGGISGKGWKHGTQTQLDFLPERHTDFAFSVLAEEFGFFGGL